MSLFKKILVPISSEFYSQDVLERSVFLAKKFDSTINLIYIIEEKTLNQTDKYSDSFRTHYERTETSKAIMREQIRKADAIVFNDAQYYFKNLHVPIEEKVARGEFSEVVKNELKKKTYDLILMGYEKGCLLNYRLLDDVDIPIWVEAQSGDHSVLAVCSNLAPNEKVPEISVTLARLFHWDLHMLYVVDMQDAVEVDKTGKRSGKKPLQELVQHGKAFADDMKHKHIDAQLVVGSLEKETVKAAERLGANLVIVGREQKKHRIVGFSAKSTRRKMADKCRYSLLFVH